MGTFRIGAAVDVGSTSVHLVVASVEPDRLVPIADESAFLGLGGIVDGGAAIGVAVIDQLVATLAGFADVARGAGARSFIVVGTEPLRRAADAARAVRLAERAGVDLHVVDHEEEALLMLIGATGGSALDGDTVVVDIGGGSTEIVRVGPGTRPGPMGIRIGAERLTVRFVRHDPVTPAEQEAMDAAARAALVAGPLPGAAPRDLIVVGGTAENVHRLVSERRGGGVLTRDDLALARQLLAATPADALATARQLRPARVRLLAAGTAILGALLDRFGADELRVSTAGLREGAIVAADRAGHAWRDRLPDLATGWRPPDPAGGGTPGSPAAAMAGAPSA